MGVIEDFGEECHSAMLYIDMDFYRLMVHAQVEGIHIRKKNRIAKKARSLESFSSKRRIDIQDKPELKKSFANHVLSNFSKTRNNRVSNPKSHKGRYVNSPREITIFGKCRKKHVGECLVRTDSCYGCGKSFHMV